MADVFALTDAADSVLLDLSAFVAGEPGSENPAFPTGDRMSSRAETFVRPGAYIGSIHDSTRQIRIPIAVRGGVGGTTNTADGVEAKWRQIVTTLAVAVGLKVQLNGTSSPIYFDILPTSIADRDYATFDQRILWLRGELRIEAQPYPRGTSATPTFTTGSG